MALEAPLPAAFALNKYIINGKGDPVKLIANLEFWMYYNKDFLELVEWMRSYNGQHNEKLFFAGFDMQNNKGAIEKIEEEFKNNQAIIDMLSQVKSDSLSLDKLTSISKHIQTEIFKTTNKELIRRDGNILVQNSILKKYQGLEYARVRDSLMAKNVIWLKDKMFKNTKIALWAHDLHIEKSDKKMGGFLAKNYGNSYVNIGFLLNKGYYTAIGNTSKKLSSENKLTKIPCNSFEHILSKLNKPVLILNNSKASQNSDLQNSFYLGYFSKRSIGALSLDLQFYNIGNNTPKLFGFLVYIENSNATSMLSN